MRKSPSFAWVTLVAGLALGLAGLRDRAPAYRSIAADLSSIEREVPAPTLRDPVRLRLAPPLRTERGDGSGDSVGASPSSPAALPGPALAAQSRRPPRFHDARSTGGRFPYYPTGPPLSM